MPDRTGERGLGGTNTANLQRNYNSIRGIGEAQRPEGDSSRAFSSLPAHIKLNGEERPLLALDGNYNRSLDLVVDRVSSNAR